MPTLLTSVPRHFSNLPDHPDRCVEVVYVMGSAQRARRPRLNSPRNMGLRVFREQVELARNDTTSGGNDIKQRAYDTHSSSVHEAAPSAPSLANHLRAAWTTLPSLRSRHSLRASSRARTRWLRVVLVRVFFFHILYVCNKTNPTIHRHHPSSPSPHLQKKT